MKKLFGFVLLISLMFSILTPPLFAAGLVDIQASPTVMVGLVAILTWLCTNVLKPLIDKLDSKLTPIVAVVIAILGTLLTGAADGVNFGTILMGFLTGGVSMAGHDLGKSILGLLKLIGVTQADAAAATPATPAPKTK